MLCSLRRRIKLLFAAPLPFCETSGLGVPAALGEESSSQTTNQTQRERSVREFATLRGNAENGDAVAQYRLGSLYMSGSEVQQNYVEAAKWFNLAAVQGLAVAQFDLGYLYQESKGGTKDYVASASYYRPPLNKGTRRRKTTWLPCTDVAGECRKIFPRR